MNLGPDRVGAIDVGRCDVRQPWGHVRLRNAGSPRRAPIDHFHVFLGRPKRKRVARVGTGRAVRTPWFDDCAGEVVVVRFAKRDRSFLQERNRRRIGGIDPGMNRKRAEIAVWGRAVARSIDPEHDVAELVRGNRGERIVVVRIKIVRSRDHGVG